VFALTNWLMLVLGSLRLLWGVEEQPVAPSLLPQHFFVCFAFNFTIERLGNVLQLACSQKTLHNLS